MHAYTPPGPARRRARRPLTAATGTTGTATIGTAAGATATGSTATPVGAEAEAEAYATALDVAAGWPTKVRSLRWWCLQCGKEVDAAAAHQMISAAQIISAAQTMITISISEAGAEGGC